MPNYDTSRYDPPAPIAQVTLRDPSSGTLVANVHLLIDTGADITLLPQSAVESLGVVPLSGPEYELRGFDGSRSSAKAVELDMLFLRKAYRGRYLMIDDDKGILGRDVLGQRCAAPRWAATAMVGIWSSGRKVNCISQMSWIVSL